MGDDKLLYVEATRFASMQDFNVPDSWPDNGVFQLSNRCDHEPLVGMAKSTAHMSQDSEVYRKKETRRVVFDKVEIYYFERSQGFVCVPSQGGSTLGMRPVHSALEVLTVSDHQDLRLLERYVTILRKHATGKISLTNEQIRFLKAKIDASHFTNSKDTLCRGSVLLDAVGSENAPPKTTERCIATCVQDSGDCQVGCHAEQLDDAPSDQECSPLCNADIENQLSGLIDCYFLQLIPVKKRRLLLRKAGVKTIDHTERIECQAIRMSREVCGCSCSNGVCSPLSCPCALDGIRCQVDRALFPCSCVEHSYCQNPHGRIEFDSARVRTHYLHTRMRLEMENFRKKPVLSISADRTIPNSPEIGESGPPLKKKAKYESSSSGSENPDLFENRICATGLSLPDLKGDDSVLSEFNTTRYGACLDCENDKYLCGLVQNLVNSKSREEDTASGNLYLISKPELPSTPTNAFNELRPYEHMWESNASGYIDSNEDSFGTGANAPKPDEEYRLLCSTTIPCCDGVADHPLGISVCQTPTISCSLGQYESHCLSGTTLLVGDSGDILTTAESEATGIFSDPKHSGSYTGSIQQRSEQQSGILEPISTLFSHRISSDVRLGSLDEPLPGIPIAEPDSGTIKRVEVVVAETLQPTADPIFHYMSLHHPETSTNAGSAPSTETSSRATSPYVETVSA